MASTAYPILTAWFDAGLFELVQERAERDSQPLDSGRGRSAALNLGAEAELELEAMQRARAADELSRDDLMVLEWAEARMRIGRTFDAALLRAGERVDALPH